MEKWTLEIIEDKFKKELDKGVLTFQSINIDEEKNSHYADDYLLPSQAVIVSKVIEGKEVKWTELENIWFLNDNETSFKVYIEKEIKEFLKTKLQPKIQ